jgi:hypothetical protein
MRETGRQDEGRMDAKIVLLYPDNTVHADVSAAPSDVPPLAVLTADVQRLLAAMNALTSDELSAAATKIRMLAVVAKARAQRRHR